MKIILKYFLSVFILFFALTEFYAQQQLLPLGKFYQTELNSQLNKINRSVNTGFKPLLKSEIQTVFNVDSLIYHTRNAEIFFSKHKRTWLYRKLFFEDFIFVNEKGFTLSVNPLFYLETAKVSGNDSINYFINTRGIEIKGNIGTKISYYSSFRENQARFRDYIYDWSWNRLVIPGQGALKKSNTDISVYDFSSASGYLSYTPFKWFNFQAGQDKNFIGEGHRSLFLSDNAMNYPFAKLNFTYKNFKYVTMFTQFQDFEKVYYDYHFKKHAAFNYLSYNYNNRIELGLFEGVIYRTTDTSAYVNKFPADFFIPIIGMRSLVNGFGSEHHVIVGLNAKLKITDFIQAYGQFAIDDPKQNKYAYQGGLKVFDILHSKIKDLKWYFQAEYNTVSSGTYSCTDLKYQTWTHYNQEFAVPFGSDFSEIFLNSDLTYKNFRLNFRYNFITLNKNGTFSDIYMLDNYTYLIIPEKEIISHKTLTVSYIINRRSGLQLYAGADYRTNKKTDGQPTEKYIMFGLRTSLNNFYYDF
ncbi:MAG: hypothetical protein DRI94_09840 [Bacteroidetes bacterium]|nr:MAG: hypothetical protein DRI94_09840 [Bacteroidota bacterium]